uniref:Secreted protein n=1 Tax=Octopus bimaculoides TaxID=37653 RepID=A0A0L8HXA1_OCTBM
MYIQIFLLAFTHITRARARTNTHKHIYMYVLMYIHFCIYKQREDIRKGSGKDVGDWRILKISMDFVILLQEISFLAKFYIRFA